MINCDLILCFQDADDWLLTHLKTANKLHLVPNSVSQAKNS